MVLSEDSEYQTTLLCLSSALVKLSRRQAAANAEGRARLPVYLAVAGGLPVDSGGLADLERSVAPGQRGLLVRLTTP